MAFISRVKPERFFDSKSVNSVEIKSVDPFLRNVEIIFQIKGKTQKAIFEATPTRLVTFLNKAGPTLSREGFEKLRPFVKELPPKVTDQIYAKLVQADEERAQIFRRLLEQEETKA